LEPEKVKLISRRLENMDNNPEARYPSEQYLVGIYSIPLQICLHLCPWQCRRLYCAINARHKCRTGEKKLAIFHDCKATSL